MNSEGSVSQFAKVIPELLENGKTVTFSPKGVSMLPTIKSGDSVTLSGPDNLKKYDIVLYIRNDGKAVLHRIIGKDKDSGYIMCGDALLRHEYGITDDKIVAKVISFTHNNKTVTAGSFSFTMRTILVLIIRFFKRANNKVKRIFRIE